MTVTVEVTARKILWHRKKKGIPCTKVFEMSSRLTLEHLDLPSSATNRKGP